MEHRGTYSPDDNKLRLYPAHRLDAETYAKVRAAGFIWAGRQELFVAPMWTPQREDLLTELAGTIEDEDTSLTERAEERAERFEEYQDNRTEDAERARAAVSSIADNIPLGQPILIGHHSERHARRDAEKIQNGMRRAVKLWETAQYWKDRAAGAVRHAKYKERPDVRARRIKKIEADRRREARTKSEAETELKLWTKDGLTIEQARTVANYCHFGVTPNQTGSYYSAWDVLQPDGERYTNCPAWTVEQVQDKARKHYPAVIARAVRWLDHYDNRLAYEKAMLEESGGTVAEKTGPEKGGACKCWASPRGGWSYIQKVNQVSVSVLDNWGNGGRNFKRTIPFDKLAAIMTAAQVAEHREAGNLIEAKDGCGFFLKGGSERPETHDERNDRLHREHVAATAKPADEVAAAAPFQAMRETIKAGVQVVTAPALFPTPPDLARRMVELADLDFNNRVLEPSAGTGNIVEAILRRAASSQGITVQAVEINRTLADRLSTQPVQVECADFLACNGNLGTFDRVLMNPPFTNAADIQHIQHALTFLKPGGRLVAICANGPRQQAALKSQAETWEDLPADTFAEAGTSVRAALVVMVKR